MSKVFAALTAGLLVAATVAAGPVTHEIWLMNHPSGSAAVAAGSHGGDEVPDAGAASAGSTGADGSTGPGAGQGGAGQDGSDPTTPIDSRAGAAGAGSSSGSGTGTSDGGTGGTTTGSGGSDVPHRRTIPSTPHPGTTPRTPGTGSGAGSTSGAVVRSVRLTLPATAQVGSNVLGYIHVTDSNGQVVSPIPGALVTLQQQRAGGWLTLSDYLTDDNGLVALSFTSRTSLTLRASLGAGGQAVVSPVTVMAAHDLVTWAARPAMTVTHGAAVTYQFRVRPAQGTARLQYARASEPTRWYSGPAVEVGPGGVVSQAVTLPSAGVWLVRGATVATSDNASGYTSVLTVRAR